MKVQSKISRANSSSERSMIMSLNGRSSLIIVPRKIKTIAFTYSEDANSSQKAVNESLPRRDETYIQTAVQFLLGIECQSTEEVEEY